MTAPTRGEFEMLSRRVESIDQRADDAYDMARSAKSVSDDIKAQLQRIGVAVYATLGSVIAGIVIWLLTKS